MNMRRLLLALGVLLLVAVAAAAVFVRSSADRTTTVDPDSLVASADDAAAGAEPADPGLRPEPGVYTYEGSGSETASALGGSSHEFGPQLAARVTLLDGCEWELELLHADEHTLTSTLCTDSDGVRLLEQVDMTKFFGISETVTTSCTDAWLMRPGDATGTTRRWTCTSDERSTSHEFEVLSGPTAWGSGSTRIDGAVRARDAGEVSGISTGTTLLLATRAPSGLPLEFVERVDVRSESPLGDVDYELDTTFELTSLDPR